LVCLTCPIPNLTRNTGFSESTCQEYFQGRKFKDFKFLIALGIIPWTAAYPTCVVQKNVTDQWLIFAGEMIVENKENLGPMSENRPGDIIRTIVSRLPFQVRYPTSVQGIRV
jgi:hypothetical protein